MSKRTRRCLTAVSALATSACMAAVPALAPPGGVGPAVAEFVESANRHRISRGCGPLVWDPAVAEVARGYSEAMRSRGFYGHVDPEGRTFTDRLGAAGIDWVRAAENIARTEHGAEQVLFLWIQSDPHRQNLENCRFERHGVGLAGEYWTHLFVTRSR